MSYFFESLPDFRTHVSYGSFEIVNIPKTPGMAATSVMPSTAGMYTIIEKPDAVIHKKDKMPTTVRTPATAGTLQQKGHQQQ